MKDLKLPSRSARLWHLPFSTPLLITVSASEAVDAFLLDEANKRKWERHEAFAFVGAVSRKLHSIQAPAGDWFLVVQNPTPLEASVTVDAKTWLRQRPVPSGGYPDMTGEYTGSYY